MLMRSASRSLRLSVREIARSPMASTALRAIEARGARPATRRRNAASSIVFAASTTVDGDVSTSSTSTTSSDAKNAVPSPPSKTNWKLKLLHDSDCPLCEREVSMLKRRDAERKSAICFVDVADPNYDPKENSGIDYETAMRTIHGIVKNEDGTETVMTGVEVFREAYELVGLGFVYAFLDVPVLKRAASALYDAWARIRLPLTGRPSLEVLLAEKKTCRDSEEK